MIFWYFNLEIDINPWAKSTMLINNNNKNYKWKEEFKIKEELNCNSWNNNWKIKIIIWILMKLNALLLTLLLQKCKTDSFILKELLIKQKLKIIIKYKNIKYILYMYKFFLILYVINL